MIRYFHPGDEDQLAAQAPIAFDEDTSWWAGVQKCGATIALAAVLATTALSTAQAAAVDSYHQDDPAGKLFGQYDEDFWQNPVFPVQTPPPPIVFRDDDVIIPQSAALRCDEDFWGNPVPPVVGKNLPLYLPDPEEIPAASLFGQPDEDYWQPLVSQRLASAPRLFSDDDVLPVAAAPSFSPDEDYWPTRIAPVTTPQVRAFSDDDVSFSSTVAFEDDAWRIAPTWSISAPRPSLPDDSVIVPQPAPLHTDEDFWVAPPPRNWPPPPAVFSADDVLLPPVPGPFVGVAKITITETLQACFRVTETLEADVTTSSTLSGNLAVRQQLSAKSVTASSTLAAANFTIIAIP